MKVWSNTFDQINSEIEAVKEQASTLSEKHPDQKEMIWGEAIKLMQDIVAENNLSPDQWKQMKQTYKQYSIGATDNPLQYAKGLARSLGQGIFLGLGDELEAFIAHKAGQIMNFNGGDEGKTYQEVLTDIQSAMSGFQKENPDMDLTAELIGGLWIPGYGAGLRVARAGTQLALKGTKVGARTKEAIAQALMGGGAGTTYTFGKEHELDATSALAGGGLAYGLQKGLFKAGDKVRSAKEKVQQGTAGRFDKIVAKLPEHTQAPGEGLDENISVGGPPRNFDDNAPGMWGRKGAWDRKAMQEIIQSADDEGVSFEELLKRLDSYVKANRGDHVSLIELVKERGHLAKTLRGLTTENASGSASYEQFLDRAIQAKKRVIPELMKLFDPKNKMQGSDVDGNVIRYLNKNKATREREAKPLYDKFSKLDLTSTDKGQQLVKQIQALIDADDAIARAWRKATGKVGYDTKIPLDADDYVLTGNRFNQFKKQLDGEIGKAIRENNLEDVKYLSEYKNDMIRVVDNIVEGLEGAKKGEGSFQKARKIYSGGLAEDNAFDLGREAIRDHRTKKFSADEFEVEFDKLTPSERSFARLGMGMGFKDALETNFDELSPNVRKLILGGAEPNVLLRKFDYAFKKATRVGPEEGATSLKQKSESFKDVLNKEGRFLKSFRYIFGGSQTADKMSEVGSLKNRMADVVDTTVEAGAETLGRGGVPYFTMGRKIKNFASPIKTRQMVRERYGDAIAERMLPMGEENVRRNLTDLLNFKRQLDMQYGYGPLKVQGLLGKGSSRAIGQYNLLNPSAVEVPPIPPDAYE